MVEKLRGLENERTDISKEMQEIEEREAKIRYLLELIEEYKETPSMEL